MLSNKRAVIKGRTMPCRWIRDGEHSLWNMSWRRVRCMQKVRINIRQWIISIVSCRTKPTFKTRSSAPNEWRAAQYGRNPPQREGAARVRRGRPGGGKARRRAARAACRGTTEKMLPKNSQARAGCPKTRIESEHRPRGAAPDNPNARRMRVKRSRGAVRPSGSRWVRNLSATPAVFRIGYQASHGKRAKRTRSLREQPRPPT